MRTLGLMQWTAHIGARDLEEPNHLAFARGIGSKPGLGLELDCPAHKTKSLYPIA